MGFAVDRSFMALQSLSGVPDAAKRHPQRHRHHHRILGQRDESQRHIGSAADTRAFERARKRQHGRHREYRDHRLIGRGLRIRHCQPEKLCRS